MSDTQELDELFASAMAAKRVADKAAAAKTVRKTAEPEKRSTQQLFLDPDNWQRTRGIALIHEETGTLLGNFSEYIHRSVAGARRLVREEAPISVSATERVEGNWWLGEDRKPEPRQAWHTSRRAFIHLHLDKLGVHSPACEVVVHLSYGSMARVELAIDTVFAQESGGEQLLTIPAETNILDVMSRDCKVRLMQDLGKEEG